MLNVGEPVTRFFHSTPSSPCLLVSEIRTYHRDLAVRESPDKVGKPGNISRQKWGMSSCLQAEVVEGGPSTLGKEVAAGGTELGCSRVARSLERWPDAGTQQCENRSQPGRLHSMYWTVGSPHGCHPPVHTPGKHCHLRMTLFFKNNLWVLLSTERQEAINRYREGKRTIFSVIESAGALNQGGVSTGRGGKPQGTSEVERNQPTSHCRAGTHWPWALTPAYLL